MAKPITEIVVFVTTPSEEEANRISRSLVEEGLVACASVLPRVRSIFRWEGKVTEEQESLIVLKTRSGLFKELATTIKKMHSYSVPEIIAIPIVQGSAEYLSWIRDVTSNELMK